MGKRAKQRRQTAHTSTGGSHTARSVSPTTPTPQAAEPTKAAKPKPGFTPGKTMLNSDPVTGVKLEDSTIKARVSSVRVDRIASASDREDGWENDTSDVPPAVSGRDVEHLSALGGRADTPGWRKYIGDARPKTVEAAEAALRDWWATPYGCEYVQRRFIEQYGPLHGRESFQAVYQVMVCHWPVWVVAVQRQHTVSWITRRINAAHHLTRA